MKLIDTHAHLYAEAFSEDQDDMMERAFEVGLSHCFLPNIDSTSIDSMLDLEARYPGRLFAMMGLHPCSVNKQTQKKELDIVEKWLANRKFCAIGEIGIDLYWDISTKNEQIDAFKVQVNWAREMGLPFVIHSRESIDLLIRIVSEMQDGSLRGIFHCFSGTKEQAEEIVKLGFVLGLGGPLTYKKSTLPDSIRDIPIQHLVLETDAPYLPPVPFRGKRNESSYIVHVAEKLAEIMNISIEETALMTSANALKLFQI